MFIPPYTNYFSQERQRLRARSAHSQLFQIHLLSDEPDVYDLHAAHAAMRGAFSECRYTHKK